MAYGEDQANTATNTGNNALNGFDPNAISNNTKSGYNSLWDTQNKTQNDFFNQYKQAINSNPTATDWYSRANSAFNVPELQQRATTLNNQVLQVPQSNIDAARGFNMDNSQIMNKTTQDLARLSPLAQAATNSSQAAQQLAGQYAGAGMQQNQINLLPIQQQGQYLMDAYARQQSGYSQAMQQEYEGLLNKMQQGIQLSSLEMQRANQLASSEYSYNQAVNSAKINAQNVTIPQYGTYLNTISGKSFR